MRRSAHLVSGRSSTRAEPSQGSFPQYWKTRDVHVISSGSVYSEIGRGVTKSSAESGNVAACLCGFDQARYNIVNNPRPRAGEMVTLRVSSRNCLI